MGKNNNPKRPPVWYMVKEAVESLQGAATYKQIKEHIWKRYPDVKERTINCQIIICSVNQNSRVYYPANRKPRECNTKYDFLYTLGNGRVMLYHPEKHGRWGIVEEDSKLVVRRLDEHKTLKAKTVEPAHANVSGRFPQVRDVLFNNLGLVSKNLQIYRDQSGREGFEYPTEIGIIDILAADEKNRLIVMEFSEEVSPEVLSRTLAFMGWCRKNLPAVKDIKGMIFTNQVDEQMLMAVSEISGLEVFELKMSLEVHKRSA
ncbi:MAG: DUF91 domain-containing protein [Syntrophomonadaceae bacterium]|nr:DUF91 domain-containing protein [Syntrophomonadaceae bacterium]